MSITDILIRSISGYVFIVPGLLLYFICLKKPTKTKCHFILQRHLYFAIILLAF